MKKILFMFFSCILLLAIFFPLIVLAEPDNDKEEGSEQPGEQDYNGETFWSQSDYATLELQELGGTPDIINVMFNGDFVKFAGAVPENNSGLTFVPLKAFFEVLGANVGYDAQTRMITAVSEDWSAGFAAGRDTVSITINDITRELPIDAAPYIKNGVSFIPIRAVAESLGFTVYWDTHYKSVVIIDKKKIAEIINKDYSILNSLLEMPLNWRPADETSYKSVLEMLISITQFNSLDSDKVFEAAANIITLSDGRNFSMTGYIAVSDLISILPKELLSSDYNEYDDEEREMIEQLSKLEKISAELIFNYEESMLYFKVPILSEFIPEIPKDAWLSVDGLTEYSDYSTPAAMLEKIGLEDFADGISVGSILSSVLVSDTYSDQIYLYSEIMDNAEVIKTLIGDEKFINKDGDYTLTLTLEDILAAEEDLNSTIYMSFNEFDMGLTIKKRSDEIIDVSGKLAIRVGTLYSTGETRIACEFDISRENTMLSFELHEKNSVKALLNIVLKTTETSVPIPTAPPEGAKVMPFEEFVKTGETGSEYWPDPIQRLTV